MYDRDNINNVSPNNDISFLKMKLVRVHVCCIASFRPHTLGGGGENPEAG